MKAAMASGTRIQSNSYSQQIMGNWHATRGCNLKSRNSFSENHLTTSGHPWMKMSTTIRLLTRFPQNNYRYCQNLILFWIQKSSKKCIFVSSSSGEKRKKRWCAPGDRYVSTGKLDRGNCRTSYEWR